MCNTDSHENIVSALFVVNAVMDELKSFMEVVASVQRKRNILRRCNRFHPIDIRTPCGDIPDFDMEINSKDQEPVKEAYRKFLEICTLDQTKSRLEVRKNFFSCRVVDSWSSLPANVQGAKDVNGFKEAYDDFIGGDYHQ